MFLQNFIIWSPDPAIVTLPFSLIGLSDRPIVWYGLLFALGFIISQQVMYLLYKKDGRPERDVDTLTTFMVIATIVGARLGHVLFYNPSYYFSDPILILKIWEGGLASHGGAIGILLAIWLYSNYEIRSKWFLVLPVKLSIKKVKRVGQDFLWVADRLVIVTALTGALIRTGNFMNSEMEGKETGSSYGVVYARGTKEVLAYDENKIESVVFTKGGKMESAIDGQVPVTAIINFAKGFTVDEKEKRFIETGIKRTLKTYPEAAQHINFGDYNDPLRYDVLTSDTGDKIAIYGVATVRHPAQLYEAVYCILIMLVLIWVWKNKRQKVPVGFSFGLFMMLLWSLRFVDEFFKMNQEAFEDSLPLNMGQWLSIPMFLIGLVVMVRGFRNDKKEIK
ncbi:MAG: prolipoprotein diacylglyceryl transferase [Cyclobacteriaceae bacterium]|nr:prolipoprotein diacylglyceryl transferase [Cyclobacteriaceae bacterium]